jgi:hypothetical protein
MRCRCCGGEGTGCCMGGSTLLSARVKKPAP